MFLLAAAMFLRAAPLDMPRAEAYLVTEPSGAMRLEDRYDEFELWMSRTVCGRWVDESGRMLSVARLDTAVPLFDGNTATRETYVANIAPIRLKDEDLRRDAADALSPFPIAEDSTAPRIPVRGMKNVEYLHGTNTTAVVCIFLPEGSRSWYYASWELAPGDDIEAAVETFEKEFLAPFRDVAAIHLRSEAKTLDDGRAYRSARYVESAAGGRGEASKLPERELLRADARHSITNYAAWKSTDAKEFSILDNLPSGGTFINILTNELGAMRELYAETVPSPLSATNSLAVARIYASRAEYLAALGENDVEGMEWSAAYWSPARRELVAYLPQDGAAELLRTIRHEAFHQYLSYATSMIPASPWFNEGYAQYFEDTQSTDWGVAADIDALAKSMPAVIATDYAGFYAGSDAERRLKYRMAWSMAHFIEKGAPRVRFKPFENLKKNYIETLLKTRDMQKANAAAFGSQEGLELFISEWKKFWLAK